METSVAWAAEKGRSRTAHRAARDVYAGDITARDSSIDPVSVFLFRIEAAADPDVLARVASMFHIANKAPQGVLLCQRSPDKVNLTVAIELNATSTADKIRRKIEQLTCTISVEWVITDPTTAESSALCVLRSMY